MFWKLSTNYSRIVADTGIEIHKAVFVYCINIWNCTLNVLNTVRCVKMFERGNCLEKARGVLKCRSGTSELYIKFVKRVFEVPVMHDEYDYPICQGFTIRVSTTDWVDSLNPDQTM